MVCFNRGVITLHCFCFYVLFALNSCGIQRNLEYLQKKDSSVTEFPNAGLQDYKLKAKDELYIQISSLDDAAATISSSSNSSRIEYGGLSPYGASLISHKIDSQGFLELPVIGKLQVKDRTIGEVTTLIKEALANVLNQPIISVKLVNTFITVLGEVRNPGHFVYSEEKLSIFDALGMAGDISDYGNRSNVLLVRNENGINVRREINILKSEALSSYYFYLRPGDVIYVKPKRSKFWGFREFPFGTVLSAITTAILVLNYTK